MKTASVLTTLLDLAEKEASNAATRLGQARNSQDAAAEKLAMLVQVRAEYSAQLAGRLHEGVSLASMRNFNQFLDKVDQAITGQQDIVNAAELRTLTARSTWQDAKRGTQSYASLIHRAELRHAQQENRNDQKATDEFAARASLARLYS